MDWINKSEFYHFGILPQVCIHSIIKDKYSKMYIPRERCDCGCSEWKESKMKMFKNENIPEKDVHRCIECNKVRMADHIGLKDE